MDRTQLRNLLGEILNDVTGETFPPLDDQQELKEHLNLDSLDLVSMAIEMQNRFNVTVESAEVVGIVTVGDLLDLVTKKLDSLKLSKAA